jgi:hypothetical protein
MMLMRRPISLQIILDALLHGLRSELDREKM